MIIVVEGISASGKSTWCERHGLGHIVAETGWVKAPPDPEAAPAAAAAFWIDKNASRWRAALAMESANDPAVCDTDPLKLHYIWCLWQIGEASATSWSFQLAATRQAIVDQRIGFADRYIVGAVELELARRWRDGDTTRTRRQFDLHVRLQPPLLTWYRTLGSVLPCEVLFGFPETVPAPHAPPSPARYDVALFDRAMAKLPLP
jgi:hypothetical protein